MHPHGPNQSFSWPTRGDIGCHQIMFYVQSKDKKHEVTFQA